MKLGILREYKIPEDDRVPLSPVQCAVLLKKYSDLQIVVEPYENRCYSNAEYQNYGITLQNNLEDCDVLLGVKEVPIDRLLANKTYLFFSHTIKKQAYNKSLLQAILAKNITLIDHETLIDERGERIIGFGKWAGIVGAHYALLMMGKKWGNFNLQPAHKFKNLEALKNIYKGLDFPTKKIALTGNGRVGKGAYEILQAAGIKEISSNDFLNRDYNECVFTVLKTTDLYKNIDNSELDKEAFYANPSNAKSHFLPFANVADVLINGIFWDFRAPRLFEKTDALNEDFKLRIIADVTCDVDGSVPYTTRQTTTLQPYLAYDLEKNEECCPFSHNSLDIMAIGNLPNELPRDASTDFGNALVENVIPELFDVENSRLLKRASICQNGILSPRFSYLADWVNNL